MCKFLVILEKTSAAYISSNDSPVTIGVSELLPLELQLFDNIFDSVAGEIRAVINETCFSVVGILAWLAIFYAGGLISDFK